MNIYQIMVKDINKIDEIIGFSMTEQVNCEDIDPTNIDDCELSDEDKKIYDRCCYLNDELLWKACLVYNEELYEEELELIKLLDVQCKSSSSSFFFIIYKLNIIIFILFLYF